MSDVEKVVVFNAIKSYLSEKDQSDLINKLNLDATKLDHRLRGLKNEDEFCLIMYFLDICEHMIGFDEGVPVLTKSYQPDMLIKLKNNERFFVEIKSVEDDKFKISGGNLQKRIDFANEFGFPLYFAVKLGGYWTLYPSDYVQSKSGKLRFPDDIEQSKFNEKFGSHFYIFKKGIKIESIYSCTEKAMGGIQNDNYGNLISYKFLFEDKLIFQADQSDESKIGYSLIVENLQNEMSIQSQVVTALNTDKTLVVEELTDDLACCDYFFFISLIKHTRHDLGFMYDSTAFFKKFLSDRKQMLTKNMVNVVLSELKSEGLPIYVANLIKLPKNKTTP